MLILDSNEASCVPEIKSALEQQWRDLVVAPLNCGDLFLQTPTGPALVERKTANDLLGSISDGRVFEQVRKMVETARFVFVVIDGDLCVTQDCKVIADGRITGWNAWSVEMALVALQAAGAIVVRPPAGAYVETIQHLSDWCARADKQWTMRKTIHFLPSEAKRDFLAQLPGVGSERVDALITECGDRPLVELLRIASTPSSTLPRLWGNGTVNKIREFLGLRGTQRIEIRERSEWKEDV